MLWLQRLQSKQILCVYVWKQPTWAWHSQSRVVCSRWQLPENCCGQMLNWQPTTMYVYIGFVVGHGQCAFADDDRQQEKRREDAETGVVI